MKNHSMALLAAAVLLAAIATPAFCVYPEAIGSYVSDYAGILNNPDKETISSLLDNFQKKSGLRMSIVVVNSCEEYGDDGKNADSFTSGLFDAWGGSGVLLLIAVKDRKISYKIDAANTGRFDSIINDVMNSRMIPSFRDGAYSRGIYEWVRAIISKTTDKPQFPVTAIILILFLLAITVAATLFLLKIKSPASVNPPAEKAAVETFGNGAVASW